MTFTANRRTFLKTSAATGLGLGLTPRAAASSPDEKPALATAPKRKFTMDLSCGAIGVGADQREAMRLAAQFGFESVDPDAGSLAALADDELQKLLADMKEKHLTWGAAGLPIDFRADDERLKAALPELARAAKGLQRAGVTRMGTWLSPGHRTLPYAENLQVHARRLGQIAKVLGDFGLRFGLEYVAPKTSWTRAKYPFVHTMAQAKELIAAMGQTNVGLVLDSWHWYTAHETADDLVSLKNEDVVVCDLNDAPAGVPIDQQQDGVRDLPCATGVIDLKAFLGALVRIGYDGPIRAEPFSKAVRAMPKEQAVATTAAAMKKAFALVE